MTYIRLAVVFALGCESGVHPLPPPSGCVIEMLENGEVVRRSTEQVFGERHRTITVERVPAELGGAQPRFDLEYDEEGRLVAVEMNQGSITTRREATYEDDRIVVRFSETESIEYTLEDGRIVLASGPTASDGSERTVRYAYDADGRLVEVEENTADPDTREPVHRLVRVVRFDGHGRITNAERMSSYGAMPETTQQLAWSYEDLADGVVVTRTIDGRAAIARFHTDTRGRLLSASADEDGDGAFDWLASYAYEDAALRMVATSTRPSASTERGFSAHGVCEAPRLPPTSLDAPVPMLGGDGRIQITIPGHDILGL
jgi:hypothetical protein